MSSGQLSTNNKANKSSSDHLLSASSTSFYLPGNVEKSNEKQKFDDYYSTQNSNESLIVVPNSNYVSKKNFSFTKDRLQAIEHENKILLKKIQTTKISNNIKRPSANDSLSINFIAPAATARKKKQSEIEIANYALLKKLQQIRIRKKSH